MIVKFKKLHPDATIPRKSHNDDFMYDVMAVTEEEVAPNVWKYGLGFALEIDKSGIRNSRVHYDIDIRPRSSVWKTGMVLTNCVGTIDQGYRGEVSMVFYHVFRDMPRYRAGQRIGQLKIGVTEEIEFEQVESLDGTERNNNGYGSTGK